MPGSIVIDFLIAYIKSKRKLVVADKELEEFVRREEVE